MSARVGLCRHTAMKPCIYCGQRHEYWSAEYRPSMAFAGVCLPVLWVENFPAPSGEGWGAMVVPDHGSQVLIPTPGEGYRLAIVQHATVGARLTDPERRALDTAVGFAHDHMADEQAWLALSAIRKLNPEEWSPDPPDDDPPPPLAPHDPEAAAAAQARVDAMLAGDGGDPGDADNPRQRRVRSLTYLELIERERERTHRRLGVRRRAGGGV
jgi:hypothetical protein